MMDVVLHADMGLQEGLHASPHNVEMCLSAALEKRPLMLVLVVFA